VTSIKEDEWIKELDRLSAKNKDDEGLTTAEWAERLGTSVALTLRKLNAANKQGRLKVGKREILRLDGKLNKTPVYSIIPAKKGK
jgi:hypothetical protein